MGALDDAIREHLELKRQHGAAEDEVAQQEKEALELGALPSGEHGLASGQGEQESPAETVRESSDLRHSTVAESGQPVESAAAPEPTPSAAPLPDELEPDEVLPEEALEEMPALDQADAEDRAAVTEHDPEPDWAPEPNGGMQAEDVLEETPDFLEEAPEHDRLWFEQRPPKDFDFDD
jgi:hypothetical protein